MNAFNRISAQQAHDMMESAQVTVVDIRDAHSFEQGHIARAKTVNDENIEIFVQETDKQIPLICYCYHGISSQNAASFFASQGFKEVYSIDGGWEEWKTVYG